MDALTNQEQLDKAMLNSGRRLVTRFFVLIKTAQNYAEGHAAVSPAAEQLLAVIRNLHRMNAEASLRLKGGYLFLGDMRLKPDASGFEAFRFLMGEMKRCFIGSITFVPEIPAADIAGFVNILLKIQTPPSHQAFAELQSLMHAAGITRIELETMTNTADYAITDDDARMDSKSRARRIYFQAMSEVDEIMSSAVKGKPLRLAKSKRIVQGMVDQMLNDPTDLIGFTTLKCREEYTSNHPVNVCIISVLVGLKAGLSKNRCCELGLAALCHDIGKAALPRELLDKETDLDQQEWQEMHKHPLVGVKLLMELKQFDNLSARMMAAAFEHHLQHDFSGYPALSYQKMGLFARIICIADNYDSLTSSRVYHRVAKTPEKVIRFMLSKAGKSYDPVILKLFVSVVGIYPVGTVLLLKTREMAVVVNNSSSAASHYTPLVKVIVSAAGEQVDGEVVDTADPSSSARSIQGVIDTEAMGVDISGFFS
jgi:HD-GYP domain-containing protein (c-di-GMP phosphodiesterase class II)